MIYECHNSSNTMGRFLIAAATMLAFAFTLAVSATAQTENVLDDFLGSNGLYPNGSYPEGTLTFDSSGNLYGIANNGGNLKASCPGNGTGCGLVFQLTPNLTGGYTQTTLHRFSGNVDGGRPTTGVVLDRSGAIYGTTIDGGSTNSGPGVVYKLIPQSGGVFKESVLYSFFGRSANGIGPTSLVLDATGILYGVTSYGGDYSATNPECANAGCGIVFQLTPTVSGPWTEKILHLFTGGQDGALPQGLAIDGSGNLFGTSRYGGSTACNCGVVYRLSPTSGGGWRESVLHTFTKKADGGYPEAGVTLDSNGNIYGTATAGGLAGCNSGCGVVFELAKSGSVYVPSILHSFTGGSDGDEPIAGVTVDSSGNVYGATAGGGNTTTCGSFGCGTVYELTQVGGVWTENVLWTFNGLPSDGMEPLGTPILDSSHAVYGNTSLGGTDDGGIIYQIVP